ncbi:acyl-CoA dehydrogenase family protein [Nocardia sp. NRRL S-836]|uniref:acyl-CoA dehydrogenase family protein n=1 Tax=Nocardia sp. NRRL S-836 TaxID=1519492 RepID=UPI0006AF1A28|nr:acyl-CoA dehydrogenase family protein [Nocardia sp. NRRL S-836]
MREAWLELDPAVADVSILDGRHPVGVVLGCCVQLATALPLLRGNGHPLTAAVESGDAIVALAATDDVGAGSDLMSMGTTARLTDTSVVVSGTKRWITNACHASHALVLARHKPVRHFTSFCWVLVPLDAPGVRVTPEPTSLFEGAGIGAITLDEVTLDRSALVGPPGRGLASFALHVAAERRAGALWAVALCRRVLRDVRSRLEKQPLGEGVLWDNAAVRERFARCVVETWRLAAVCSAAVDLASAMALKVAVADGLDLVLRECTQLLGAEAFVDGGIAELRAAVAMFGVAGGAVGAMLAGVAEHADELLGVR